MGWKITSVKGQTEKTQVLYISDSTGNFLDALKLDTENIEVTPQTVSGISFSGLNDYDVVVLNDVNLTQIQLNDLSNWAETDGHGVIIIMGPALTVGNQILSTFRFTSVTQFENNSGDITQEEQPNEFNKLKGISVANIGGEGIANHPIIGTIIWNTAPETFYWTKIPDIEDDVIMYVNMQWNDAGMNDAEGQNYPAIAGISVGDNQGTNIFLFTGWLQDDFTNADATNANVHVVVWPFFNYLVFTTVQSAAGNPVPAYGNWKFSPVPHYTEQLILGIIVFVIAVISVWLFIRARKKKEMPKDYFEREEKEEEKEEEDEAENKDIYVDIENLWEKVGFHRQLSGFLKLFFVMMILIVPQLLISSMIMPQFINPYPQSTGWYSYTLHFFEAIWLVFDMGFNYAIIKFFAQHRIEHPEKAYHYVQLFIWWEMLSGVVQIGLIAFIGSIIFPFTQFNYLSWMFVTHSLIQFPGIFLVFQYFFQGSQRSDFQMISYALQALVLRLILQVVTVPICKFIFEGNVMYGAAFGTSIGLLVGQLIGDWALFFITWKLYKSLKLPSKPLFWADFNKEEFIETIKLGSKMAMGGMLVPLVWLLQVYWVQLFIPNSSQEQGYFELAWTISQIPMAIVLMTSGLLGALTEAHEYKKHKLLQYNTISGLKWGFTWTLYLSAVFFAIGESFIVGASGAIWIRSAQLLPLLLVQRCLGPFSWQTDQEFAAADKAQYAGIAWFIEQSLRAVLMFVFLFKFRLMESVLFAYIISLIVKNVFVLIVLRKKIHTWNWNIWPSYIAPLISAGIVFVIFRIFDFLIVSVFGLGQGIISALLLLILALFAGEFIHSFFYGFFGGYDDNTLKELDVASDMVTGVNKLARFYYKCAATGARISPLHNKFPIKIYEEAMKEADEITAIKRKFIQ
ncbi:MAG: lipopolysaccharide biosynthesis protein [Promethearchaeota archaeon]